jgi:acetoin utilization protein AcuB
MDRISAKQARVSAVLMDSGRQGDLLVRDVMTVAPSCVPPTTTVPELIDLFHAKLFRHMLVTCPERGLVGVISDRDVIRCLGPDKAPKRSRLATISAGDIMSTDILTIGPNTPLGKAVQIIVDQGISCLPVLVDGTPVGILTNTDLHVVLQSLLQTLPGLSSEKPAAVPASSRKN